MSRDLAAVMAEVLRILADEVENNRSLARKLSAPWEEFFKEAKPKEVKGAKKARAVVPEEFDPFRIYYDRGKVGLYDELAKFDAPVLKAILTHFSLDPSRSYTRLRKPEKLRDLIVEKVKAMGERGEAFRSKN